MYADYEVGELQALNTSGGYTRRLAQFVGRPQETAIVQMLVSVPYAQEQRFLGENLNLNPSVIVSFPLLESS